MADPPPEVAPSGASVGWAVALVAALHLLTTPATWIITDQAEALFAARRLITDHTLDLAGPDDGPVAELPWLTREPGRPLRSRLLPATALALVPLLLLDRLLGWEDARDYGRLVHLQGHLFVLAGVGLLGWAARRAGRTPSAAAAAVVLTGTAWPVWQVSKRAGAAAILFFLVALFLTASSGPPRRAFQAREQAIRAACCALLPWVNPVGAVVSALLVTAAWLEREGGPLVRTGRQAARDVAPLAAGCLLGNLSVMLVWNHSYHGHWWLGGYGGAQMGHEGWFAAVPFSHGLLLHVREFLRQAPWLVVPALWFGLRGGTEGRRQLVLPAALTLGVLVLFATFYAPEPARRLSVVCPAWALATAWAWDRAAWRPPWPLVALAGSALLGFSWFMAEEGRHYPGPGGLFYPSVLWVKLALTGAPAWKTVLPVAFLLAVGAQAARRLRAMVTPAA